MTWLDVAAAFTLVCVTLVLGWQLLWRWGEDAEMKHAAMMARHPSAHSRFMPCNCGLFDLYQGEPFVGRIKVHSPGVCYPVHDWIDADG